MFTYIRPINFNVQVFNGKNLPAKGFGLVIVKIPIFFIKSLRSSCYIPINLQNIISQTTLKHYNQFRSKITEAIRWLQIATDTGKKLKFKTTVKARYQQLLDFIKIDVLNIEQQNSAYQTIITLPMTPIINSYFNKHPMSW